MLEKEAILKLLEILNEDIESNKKKIKLHFGNIKLINQENQNLLHIFVDNKYDEKKCFLAIKTLLELGVNPNHTSDYKYNFVQRALYSNYSEEFILKISEEAFKHGLNPNHQDEDKDTVIFTAIYSEDYFGGIEKLLQFKTNLPLTPVPVPPVDSAAYDPLNKEYTDEKTTANTNNPIKTFLPFLFFIHYYLFFLNKL